MTKDYKPIPENSTILFMIVLLNVTILKASYILNMNGYWLLLVSAPLLFMAIIIAKQKCRYRSQLSGTVYEKCETINLNHN